ncbi:MAG: RHS repeat-associated core domain-containing protein [Terracoccus sp.]
MLEPGRKYSIANTNYRYGFNGKENDNDIENGAQDYGMRIYDGRLGRFLSVDPITKKYPELTPYQFASNRPIDGIDLDGLEWWSNFKKWLVTPIKAWNTPDGKPPKISPEADKAIRENVNKVGNILLMIQGHFEMQEASLSGLKSSPSPSSTISSQEPELKTLVADSRDGSMEVSEVASTSEITSKTSIEANSGNTNAAISNQISQKKLQVGAYFEMSKLNAKSGLSSDHIPSFAAIKKYVETLSGAELTLAEEKALRKSSLTIVYETQIHQTVSRTFGGRNNPIQIVNDAANLLGAIEQDVKQLTPSLLKAGYKQEDINAGQQQLIKEIKTKLHGN